MIKTKKSVCVSAATVNFSTIKTRKIQNIRTVSTGAFEPSFTEVIISRFRFITHTYTLIHGRKCLILKCLLHPIDTRK